MANESSYQAIDWPPNLTCYVIPRAHVHSCAQRSAESDTKRPVLTLQLVHSKRTAWN